MAVLDVLVETPCEINTKKAEMACAINCLGRDQVSALKLYLLVQILILLLPGTYGEFTLDDWKELLKEWQALSETEREAAEVGSLGTLAEAAGLTLSGDPSELMRLAKCYFCVPKETRLNLIAGLECLLMVQLAAQQNRVL